MGSIVNNMHGFSFYGKLKIKSPEQEHSLGWQGLGFGGLEGQSGVEGFFGGFRILLRFLDLGFRASGFRAVGLFSLGVGFGYQAQYDATEAWVEGMRPRNLTRSQRTRLVTASHTCSADQGKKKTKRSAP